MKIGILTYHRPCNFGANLQAYASSQYLKSLGHDVKVIDYVREVDRTYYASNIPQEQFNAHKLFVEKQLPLTKQVTNEKELIELVASEGFDRILVGADAVWSATKNYRIFFGCWYADNIGLFEKLKLSSLSPAIMGEWYPTMTDKKREEIKNGLNAFSCISVRDNWTKWIVENDVFDQENKVNFVNPDPVTMIDSLVDDSIWDSRGLNKKEFVAITLPAEWLKGRKMSFVRKRWFDRFKKCVNKAGYKLVELPLPEGPSGLPFDYIYNQPFDAIQWYLTLKNSRAYLGLRFHAVVCCIAAGVPFYSIDSYCKRPSWTALFDMMGVRFMTKRFDSRSKIYNLLDGTGLEENRNGGFVELHPAKHICHKLLSINPESIVKVSNRNIEFFSNNIIQILK